MMSYQLLALDLDGTLTNSKKEISKPTLNALLDIQRKGVKVVLASGRPTVGVRPLAEQLHLGDYGVISSPLTEGALPTAARKKSSTVSCFRKTLHLPCSISSKNMRALIFWHIKKTPLFPEYGQINIRN